MCQLKYLIPDCYSTWYSTSNKVWLSSYFWIMIPGRVIWQSLLRMLITSFICIVDEVKATLTNMTHIHKFYCLQITWFGDMPLWTSILGAFIVVVAVFVMAFEEAFLNFLKKTCGSQGWCWNLQKTFILCY